MVDGSSRLGAFVRILLPLVAPGLVATSVFAFITGVERVHLRERDPHRPVEPHHHRLALVLLRDEPEHGLGRADGRVDAHGDPRGRLLPPRPAPHRVRADLGRRQGVSGLAAPRPGRCWSSRATWRLSPRSAAQGPPPAFATRDPAAARPGARAGRVHPRADRARSSSARRPPEAGRVGELLAAEPAARDGLPPARRRPRQAGTPRTSIALALTPGDRALGDEGYRLVVDARRRHDHRRPARGPLLRRADAAPAAARGDRGGRPATPGRGASPRGTIHDRPRFAWRGAMLDVARHFFGVDDVKRLDRPDGALQAQPPAPAPHRRPGLADRDPLVAAAGEPSAGAPQVGGGPGGYYTQAQYAEIVAYAARALRRRRAGDRHARAHQRRARVVRRS